MGFCGALYGWRCNSDGPVVQWLEPSAHNRVVAGSNPAGPICFGDLFFVGSVLRLLSCLMFCAIAFFGWCYGADVVNVFGMGWRGIGPTVLLAGVQ